MNMDAAKMLAIHDRMAVQLKTQAVKRHRGAWDLNPILLVTFDNKHYAGQPIESKMGDDFNLAAAVAVDVALLWNEVDCPIERIVVVSDAYVKLLPSDGDPTTISRGDIGREFRTKADSDVAEAMVSAFVWHDDGHYYAGIVTQRYAITDGGQLRWVEDPSMPAEIVEVDRASSRDQGAVIEAAWAVMQLTRDDEEE